MSIDHQARVGDHRLADIATTVQATGRLERVLTDAEAAQLREAYGFDVQALYPVGDRHMYAINELTT